mgnify:CR=1 FL=1
MNRVNPEAIHLHAGQRRRMVEEQLGDRGIRDLRLLEVMTRVPRHLFALDSLQHRAYGDTPLPIGENQTISQPYIVAAMTEALGLKGDERVLEIGTGSGYQAAVLAELSNHIFTIEIIPELAEGSEKVLKELGYENITVRTGDGYMGWPEEAPFDRIIVTAAPGEIPEKLVEQLDFLKIFQL